MEFRDYPQATTLLQTDAFALSRLSDGTHYVEWSLLGNGFITPQQFDALAGQAGHDSTAAINAAEASLGPGGVLWFPAGTYEFTSQLASTRQQFCWAGLGEEQSALLYTGSSTTIDLLYLSNIDGAVINGLGLQSRTVMTAGTGAHIQNVARGFFNLMVQGQDAFNTLGNTLFHGIWFDRIDDVHFNGRSVYAQEDGIRINGDTAGGGLKADLNLWDGTKISECTCGIRVGGAFGGLYVGAVALAENAFNIVVDQTIAAQNNREIFLTGTVSDVTTSGPGLEMNDPGGVLLQASNCWFSSAAGHGVYIAQNAGRLLFTGCRFFNNNGDGIRVDAATSQVSVVGGASTNNAGYGINPNVASNNVTYDAVNLRDNTTGPANLAHPGLIASSGYSTQYQFLAVMQELEVGDSGFFAELQGGNPIWGYDVNDFYKYDRTANQHEWLIGNNLALVLASTGATLYNSGTAIATFGANGMSMGPDFPMKSIATSVSALPSAATVGDGARCFVPDSTLAYLGTNIGTPVVGSGTHEVPVVAVAGVWVIG